MVDTLDPKPGFAFWLTGALALLWNLAGFLFLMMQLVTPDRLRSLYSAEQVDMILGAPFWATAMTALATTAGVLGSIFLLLRRRRAVPAFIVSLLALVGQDIYIFGMTPALEVFGLDSVILQAVILAIAAILLGYSQRARARGFLR